MPDSVIRYVQMVCLSAIAALVATYLLVPASWQDYALAVAVFSALGVLAELLVYELPGGAQGSISFVPFLAAVVVAPNWIAVLGVATANAVVESVKRRGYIKAGFNVAQVTLAVALAVLSYRSLGGVELGAVRVVSFTDTAKSSFLPIVFAGLVFFLSNSLLVSGAIALSSRSSVLEVWRGNTLSMLTFDILASPAVLLLAWLFIKGGPLGALLVTVPMLVVRQLYATNARLSRVNQELLELMVKAIEARDPYTSGHSRRVSHYARIIARAVGLPRKDVERVATAALLHDVGKIHEVFAPILRKPDKLDPAEWEIMQTHSAKSAELVGTVSHLHDIVSAVRHHHENWDGTGYPDGLRGPAIPAESRIIIFADMIDAMTTDRPYRRALGQAEVRAELIRCRGRQFDPDICDQLLASPAFALIFEPQAAQRTCQEQHSAFSQQRRRNVSAIA